MARGDKPIHWILWWQTDEAAIDTQVREYHTRAFLRSSRGVAAGCLLLSVIITVTLMALRMWPLTGAIDAGLLLFLAIFVYLGHRWAMIAAMAFWTLEKLLTLAGGLVGAGGSSTTVLTNLVWWCLYMHALYVAFRVEQRRRGRGRREADAPAVFD